MYPTLYHFVFDLFGISLPFLKNFNTFGLLVAIAFLVAHAIFTKEIKRKTKEGLLIEKETSPLEHVNTITLIAIIFGFLGAKIFAWLEDPIPLSIFLSDPFSGLTIYGGLITAFLASVFYLKRYKEPILIYMDAVAPALMLGYGIGRLGCHISGDGDWGIVNNSTAPIWIPKWLWSYNYPNNVLQEGELISNCIYNDFCYQLSTPVYPTPLYESIVSLLLFGILWFLRKKIKTAGLLFFIYVFFNGLERFFIEKIRVNTLYYIGDFAITQAEIISIFFILIGIIGIVFFRNKT